MYIYLRVVCVVCVYMMCVYIYLRVVCVVCVYIYPGDCRCYQYFIIWQQNMQVHTRAASQSHRVCVCLRAGQPALFLPLCVIQCAKCANIFPYTLHVLLTRGSSICGCSCIVLEKCDRRGGRTGLLFCGIIFVASSARTVPATRRIALRLWPRDFISGGS